MNVSSKIIGATLLLCLGQMTVPALAESPSVSLSVSEPAQAALTHLAAMPNSPLPEGTQLRGVTIKDGLATVDLSREFTAHYTGGDSNEPVVVNSILKAMGRFPNVNEVQLLVGGQPIDTLGGVLELSKPLPVIRTATPRPLYFHRRAHGTH